MFARRHSYIPALPPSQSARVCGALAVATLTLSLGGCAGLGLPFGAESTVRTSAMTTGSIKPTLVSAKIVDSVDASDWEAIRRTVASASDTAVDTLAWRNPDTGSAGTVSALSAAEQRSGHDCRTLITTINDQHGVRRYRGQTCRMGDGRWQLFGMVADDAQFS
jgi:surface antigen